MPLGHYSPTRLFTGSTIPAADSHAKCGKVTPRGARQAGIVKVNRASSLMPAAIGRTKHGRSSCRAGRPDLSFSSLDWLNFLRSPPDFAGEPRLGLLGIYKRGEPQ